MNSRHCLRCDARWPPGYVQCPTCEALTKIVVSRMPNRSKFQANEAIFRRQYEAREQQRIAEGHLAPEALGKREARELIRLEKMMDGPTDS